MHIGWYTTKHQPTMIDCQEKHRKNWCVSICGTQISCLPPSGTERGNSVGQRAGTVHVCSGRDSLSKEKFILLLVLVLQFAASDFDSRCQQCNKTLRPQYIQYITIPNWSVHLEMTVGRASESTGGLAYGFIYTYTATSNIQWKSYPLSLHQTSFVHWRLQECLQPGKGRPWQSVGIMEKAASKKSVCNSTRQVGETKETTLEYSGLLSSMRQDWFGRSWRKIESTSNLHLLLRLCILTNHTVCHTDPY